jgi:WD and tetratricopeptide repeats protein 1
LDSETVLPDEEGHDIESNILHGSLNLRIHRRSDSSIGTGRGNGSCESPSSSCQIETTAYQVLF